MDATTAVGVVVAIAAGPAATPTLHTTVAYCPHKLQAITGMSQHVWPLAAVNTHPHTR